MVLRYGSRWSAHTKQGYLWIAVRFIYREVCKEEGETPQTYVVCLKNCELKVV